MGDRPRCLRLSSTARSLLRARAQGTSRRRCFVASQFQKPKPLHAMLHGLIDAYRRLAEHPGDFEEAILKLVGFGTCLFCHGSVDDLVRG